ncbi:MAG: peptide deformylase [Bacteroidaceae bacterium]|nr:peptide deformylase [Bacteroidaceae bacterium]
MTRYIVRGWSLSLVFVVTMFISACNSNGWSKRELTIIDRSDSVMFVTTLPDDSVILRTPSVDVSMQELKSQELQTLMAKMLRTVTDPSQDGVGIAAPQVGINRRIIWVQRLDKEGEPFECYVNIRIDSLYGETRRGPEGCLSVPGYAGMVTRNTDVVISYADLGSGNLKKEHVEGYTAVIFQHECDHLDGILYVDRADSVFINQTWMDELKQYEFTRPDWW